MSRERAWVAVAAAALLYLVFFRAGTFVYPFPSGSNGVFFDEAWRVLQGEVMYRDFFEFVGPGTAHLNALVLLLAGPRIAAFGAAAVALGAGLALLVHALSARLLPAPWRLLPPFAFLALAYAPYTFGDHKWPALCLAFAAVGLAAGAPSTARAFGAGLLLGVAVLFTQDLGAGCTAGLVLFLWWRRGARHAVVAAGAASIVPLLALAVFAWKAGLATVAYDWIVFPFTRYRELNRFRLTASLSPRTLPRDLAQLTLAVAGVAGGLAALRRRDAASAPDTARALALAGLGAFVATAHRGLYPAGLVVQSALLGPLGVWILWRRLSAASWRARPVAAAAVAMLVAGVLHGSIGFAAWRQFLQPMTLERHRAGAVWTAWPMPELAWIESRTRAGEAAFLMPARGGHYFLTHTRDVTRFPYLIEGQHTAAQAQGALSAIERARPAVGLWDQRPWPRGGNGVAEPLGWLFEGLARSYAAERLASGVVLLTRKESPLSEGEGPGPRVGETIGPFEAPDQHGTRQSLDTLRGPNGLLLNFNRSVVW